MDNVEIHKTFTFEAAHFLPNVVEGHKCRNLHGHSYKITLILYGPIDPQSGWLIDFNEIKHITKTLIKSLDHKLLNNIEGLENPTSENISAYIYSKLKPIIPFLDRVILSETRSTKVIYPVKKNTTNCNQIKV